MGHAGINKPSNRQNKSRQSAISPSTGSTPTSGSPVEFSQGTGYTGAMLNDQRSSILEVANRFGASRVRVFGSTARGEQTESSDLDLLVCLDEERTLFDLVELSQALSELLGQHVDVVTERSLHPLLRDRVLEEAQPL